MGFESWWGPEGFRAKVHALEARPGGGLHYEMIADTPEMTEVMQQMGRPQSHAARARFSEFRPQQRLAITSLIDFLPGVKPYETTMTVEFFTSGDYVRMAVTREAMHDEEFTKMSIMGFISQLVKLDKRFANHTKVSAHLFDWLKSANVDGLSKDCNSRTWPAPCAIHQSRCIERLASFARGSAIWPKTRAMQSAPAPSRRLHRKAEPKSRVAPFLGGRWTLSRHLLCSGNE